MTSIDGARMEAPSAGPSRSLRVRSKPRGYNEARLASEGAGYDPTASTFENKKKNSERAASAASLKSFGTSYCEITNFLKSKPCRIDHLCTQLHSQ